MDQGGGSGGPGHGTPQAFNSAVELPRARLGRRQRSIGPGRAVDQGGSARDVGLGGGSVEDLGMNASTLERIRFAAANRLCVDVGYLLSGLVKCKACGRALSGQDAKSGQFSYYVCQSIMKRGKNACVTPRLNARRFEQMIVDNMDHRQSTRKTAVLVGGGPRAG